MRRQQQPIIGITLNDIFKALEDKEVTTKINNLFSHFKPSLYAGSAVDLTNPDNLHRFLKDCVTRDVFGKIKHSNGVEETNEEYKNRVSQPQYNIAQLTANVKLDLDKYGKVHLYMKFGQNKENIWEMSVEETLKIASSIFKQAILDGDNKEKMLFEHVLSYPLVQKEEEKLDQDALALNQILQEFEEKRIELQQYCIEIEMKKLALENELQVLLFQQEEGLNLKENNVVLKNQLKEMQKREQQLKVQLQESARQLEIVKINHQNEQSKLESEIQSIFQAKEKQEQQKLQENYKVQNQQPSTPGNTLMFAGKQILTLAMSDTYGQQGWTMASHRYYDKDKRDNCSTFVCVHKAPDTCWEFIFTPVGSYYKIYLIDTSQNRGDYGQNNYALTCHNALTEDRRDQVSIRVFVHQYDQYEGQLWEVISDQESGKYRIALADPNSQFRGWFLTSHRSGDVDKRDSQSTYLCLHKEKRQSQLWNLSVNPSFAGDYIMTMLMTVPYGRQEWRMTCHNIFPQDKRDDWSSFAFIHRSQKECQTFRLTPVGANYKITLVGNNYNQNDYTLTSHKHFSNDQRDNNSSRVFIHKGKHGGQLWKIIPDQASGKFRIALADQNEFHRWYLTAQRNDTDKRDGESYFLFLHKNKLEGQLWNIKKCA